MLTLLQSSKPTSIFTQGTAPLTCLAIGSNKTVYTGSWDKTIYAINPSSTSHKVQTLTSHTDFIKCLLTATLSQTPILLSGSADATIIVWDLTTNRPLHKLKGHTKALQDLAIDPQSLQSDASGNLESFTLYSASSDREIRRWHISLKSACELSEDPILAHDTSVYRIRFDADGDLWTASADKTAKHLVRDRNWESDTTLQHLDFVRDVLPFEELGLVVTACRDEEVRVWEISSGKLVCTYTGHFEEITGLARVAGNPRKVVSVSIDGTVRQWSLERQDMVKYQEDLAKGEKKDEEVEKKEGLLTAEEEAELAELMDDDD